VTGLLCKPRPTRSRILSKSYVTGPKACDGTNTRHARNLDMHPLNTDNLLTLADIGLPMNYMMKSKSRRRNPASWPFGEIWPDNLHIFPSLSINLMTREDSTKSFVSAWPCPISLPPQKKRFLLPKEVQHLDKAADIFILVYHHCIDRPTLGGRGQATRL
jgi:hypothetical protein